MELNTRSDYIIVLILVETLYIILSRIRELIPGGIPYLDGISDLILDRFQI